ncbi:MAG: crotonase/enoyl-CoA hydratase family protein [Pseudomonadota bacterium]
MSERVLIEEQDGIAVVTLNRPEKLNALDPETFDALSKTGADISARPDLRAVILRGAGGNFSAGLDVSGMGSSALSDFPDQAFKGLMGTPANRFQHPVWVWHAMQIPVIAVLEGICFGGGFQIASGADIRLAAPDARFSIMESKWGLVPDMGMTAVLRGVVRRDVLKRLSWTSEIIDAPSAADYGLVSEVCDTPMDAALALAKTLTERSPDAVRAIKTLIDTACDAEPETALKIEAHLQWAMLQSANQKEAVMANLQKRAPEFSDPESDPKKVLDAL